MTPEQAEEMFLKFKEEDERIYREYKEEVEKNGHPFTICTNGARWLHKNFFPRNSKVMGYSIERNPTAEIGKDIFGHDFLFIQGRYVLDFWYRHVIGKEDCPILIDMLKEPELLKRYYGDPARWVRM